jgi:hypothetical protein
MRHSAKVFGARVLGVVVVVGAGYVPVVACSDATPKKTPTVDAGPSPYPTYNDPFPTSTTPATTTPVPFDASPPPGSSACDTTLNLTEIRGCGNFTTGARACATNSSLSPYPFTTTRQHDVVTCNGSAASCVQHCTALCVAMPSGFPDECDECSGKVDGTYCGTEMIGWSTKNNKLLIHCRSGVLQTSPGPQDCVNGCQTSSPQGTARCL